VPVEVSVGPPVLTINHGSTFMVTDRAGQIAADSEQGVFCADTRFVSSFRIFANGESWLLLSSGTPTYYMVRVHLMNRAFKTEDGDVPEGTLALTITRAVGEGIHEDLDLTNYGLHAVRFNLEIALRSDFADLFEVKAQEYVRRGHVVTEWDDGAAELRTSYTNRDFQREFRYRVARSTSPASHANGRVTFEIALGPGATWRACAEYLLIEGGRARVPVRDCATEYSGGRFDALEREWRDQATGLISANEDVYRLYRQSVEDMGALRLYDHDFAHDVWLPAAGVPWFVTIFGRDSLIVSLQNMLVNPAFVRGTLKRLAQFQAGAMDDWRDAEPGKILHELRFGELAYFHRVPHTPYYGTADATSLYLIALHEGWKWLGDDALLRDYREVALRCLEWIERYGDLDGDGFQEYRTRSAKGYSNMAWKDAEDAVMYPDGRQVPQPKALCELQGYVFDAWLRMAEIFEVLGERGRAVDLRDRAVALQQRFEARFWCEDLSFYAYCLDPDKQPVRTIASNAGHLLWSGIVSPERAARVVARLLEPDMWSGWGIRTLSARHPAYDPYLYQRGSVWPHDNGIIALGFTRYGFTAEAARIARDISEAASHFASYRLPELYAGVERQPGGFPVQYLGANVPQAWAAGSVFHLLQAILGIRADAPEGRLLVDPHLPQWLPDVTLHGLAVGGARVDLKFWLEGQATRWDASVRAGRIAVEGEPWRPWTIRRGERSDSGVRPDATA
jgi:glycogen debranching enzyme